MKPLKFLENKYRGHRIFIVGSGPSLRGMPLYLLENEYTFGINRIGMKLIPTFYWLATGNARLKDYLEDVMISIEAAEYAFVASFMKDVIKERPNIHWIDVLHVNGKNPTMPGEFTPEDWAAQDVATGRLSAFGHSGNAVMRLAAYMGFDPIYLIGMDGKYKVHILGESDPNHFNENYESGELARPEVLLGDYNNSVWHSHISSHRGSLLINATIKNAGTSPYLTHYPRVKFEDLFPCANLYRFMTIYRSFLSQKHMKLGKSWRKK